MQMEVGPYKVVVREDALIEVKAKFRGAYDQTALMLTERTRAADCGGLPRRCTHDATLARGERLLLCQQDSWCLSAEFLILC